MSEVIAKLTKLAKEGPFKHEPTKRRIRGLLGGQWVFDTLDAEYVWEHPYCKANRGVGRDSTT